MKEHFPDLRLARYAMGTRFEIAMFGKEAVHLRAAGEAALDEIEWLSDQLDLFKPDSFLSHLNRRALAGPVRMDSDLFALLEICRDVHEASEGAFDITVGPLMRSWGFREQIHGRDHGLASEDALKRVGARNILLDRKGCALRFAKPGMAVDLGAVAKGFALDRAAAILREAGVERALLHGGTSTIMALGPPPGADAWLVALDDPLKRGSPIGKAALKESALSLSSPKGRMQETESGMKGHVMDPKTGAPAESVALAAAVSSSAALSDAWSTVLVVKGRALLSAWAAQQEALAGLVCCEVEGGLRCEAAGKESGILSLPGLEPGAEERGNEDG
jgi:thiamine biosynthesis lipoprotein